MPRFAIIGEGGAVVNIVKAEPDYAEEQGWIAAESASIGDVYEDGQFVKPTPAGDAIDYRSKRAAAYPPMSDYLDGIVKGDDAQVQAYIDACLAVKAKYPKPTT